MCQVDRTEARDFATEIVRTLRDSGYEALWAGGCVRDQLMGIAPKDYDVATSATPDEVRRVFGRRRTLAIGAAFGVITVLGPARAGQVEVATFRCDAAYTDGRHPDHVSFSSAKDDAQRRDFTINGLFYDPLANQVIDYVDGQQDLQRRLVRAIGDPHERIGEDKLRMLRAVRFATTLGFDLDDATFAAVRDHATEIEVVSVERIADEMRRTLVHPRRRGAVELLQQSGLLAAIVPELQPFVSDPSCADREYTESWHQTLEILDRLEAPTFSVAMAALLRGMFESEGTDDPLVCGICRRWRLSNEEMVGIRFCLNRETPLRSASRLPWPELQRLLVSPRVDESISFAAAVACIVDSDQSEIDFCRAKLALPAEVLDPAPLITGDDLRQLGMPPGPAYREILDRVRDAQLLGQITSCKQALELAKSLQPGDSPPANGCR